MWKWSWINAVPGKKGFPSHPLCCSVISGYIFVLLKQECSIQITHNNICGSECRTAGLKAIKIIHSDFWFGFAFCFYCVGCRLFPVSLTASSPPWVLWLLPPGFFCFFFLTWASCTTAPPCCQTIRCCMRRLSVQLNPLGLLRKIKASLWSGQIQVSVWEWFSRERDVCSDLEELTSCGYDDLSQVVSVKREIKGKRHSLRKRKKCQTTFERCTGEHVCLSHRCFPVRAGQDAVDLYLALVQRAQIHPELLSPFICRTKTLPTVEPLRVLLRGKSECFKINILMAYYMYQFLLLE